MKIRNILSESLMNSNAYKQHGFVAVAVLVVLGVGVIGTGTAVAANSARPGDALYGIDKAVENLRLALSLNNQSKAELNAKLAGERLDEMESLIADNAPEELIENVREQYALHYSEAMANVEEARQAGEDVRQAMSIIAENAIRNDGKINEIVERVPEAKAELDKAKEASQSSLEDARDSLGESEIQQIIDGIRVEKPSLKISVPPPRYQTGTEEPDNTTNSTDTEPSKGSQPDAGLDPIL